MNLLIGLAALSVVLFGAVLFVMQLAAHEVGYWLGRRRSASRDIPGEGVGVVVGAVLGLLAFVLALTLSFANARFDERRAGTLAEANAIGTAWLRAKAIGQPRGDEIARLLEDYAKARMAYVADDDDAPALAETNRRTGELQSAIWGHASAIVREQADPVRASLMASLNDVFDMTTAERFAFELQLPPQVFWLLIGLTLLGMAMLGYQLGLRGQRVHVLALLLTLTWTVVIVAILDLAWPRFGGIRTSVAAYEWTLQGFQDGVTVPPAPR